MKASIITFSLSDNYGAILQTYGLAHAVKALGHEVEVYRYQDWSRVTYGMSTAARIKHEGFKIAKEILTQGKRRKRFSAFREKHIPLTERLYENNHQLRQDSAVYDVYISGSDQIWNPKVFAFDYSYFLDFVPENARRISYASSFGSAGFDPGYKERCGKLLEKYSHISVREKSGEATVADLCGKEATTCVDPTLLLTRQDWESMIQDATPKAKAFHGILCYIMPGDKLVTDAIEALAQQLHQKTGLPIMRLGVKEHTVFSYKRGETDIKAGPSEFLAYFAGAQYVVTNSFHGTAFSVNFGKEAYIPINDTLPKEKALHERIVSLLTQVGAADCMIPASDPILPENKRPDLNVVSTNLEELRQASMAYLKHALETE